MVLMGDGRVLLVQRFPQDEGVLPLTALVEVLDRGFIDLFPPLDVRLPIVEGSSLGIFVLVQLLRVPAPSPSARKTT